MRLSITLRNDVYLTSNCIGASICFLLQTSQTCSLDYFSAVIYLLDVPVGMIR